MLRQSEARASRKQSTSKLTSTQSATTWNVASRIRSGSGGIACPLGVVAIPAILARLPDVVHGTYGIRETSS